MLVDLVQATTRDGVRLDGMFQQAAEPSRLGVDALCLVHGTGGNFYSSTLFDALAERLLAHGVSVLRVNTRGHDGISTASTSRGGVRLGAAYEIVADCRHDLAAWMSWLDARHPGRNGLLGHSLGAVKALYACVQDLSLAPACVLAISPPRLSYAHFLQSPEAALFHETYVKAEQLAAAGRGGELMDVRIPLPYAITVAGYLEKYGPESAYDFTAWLSSLRCPTLFTFGDVEITSNMAFRGSVEIIRQRGLPVEVIKGADHFYSGKRAELAETITSWLGGKQ